jgi:hypothetical protein
LYLVACWSLSPMTLGLPSVWPLASTLLEPTSWPEKWNRTKLFTLPRNARNSGNVWKASSMENLRSFSSWRSLKSIKLFFYDYFLCFS